MEHVAEMVGFLKNAIEKDEKRLLGRSVPSKRDLSSASIRFYEEEWVHYLLLLETIDQIMRPGRGWWVERKRSIIAGSTKKPDFVVLDGDHPTECYEIKGPDYVEPDGRMGREAEYVADIKKQAEFFNIEPKIKFYVLWVLHGDPHGRDRWLTKVRARAEHEYSVQLTEFRSDPIELNHVPTNDRCKKGYDAVVIAYRINGHQPT